MLVQRKENRKSAPNRNACICLAQIAGLQILMNLWCFLSRSFAHLNDTQLYIASLFGCKVSKNFLYYTNKKKKIFPLLHKRPGEDDVSQELADGDTDDGDDDVGTHETEHYRDGAAKQGEKGEETHPCTVTRHEAFCLVETLLLDVKVFLYPVKTPHASYAVVEHRTENVADGSVDDEFGGFPFA